MPFTASRNSNWFGFYRTLKIADLGLRNSISRLTSPVSRPSVLNWSQRAETLHSSSLQYYLAYTHFLFSKFELFFEKLRFQKGFWTQKNSRWPAVRGVSSRFQTNFQLFYRAEILHSSSLQYCLARSLLIFLKFELFFEKFHVLKNVLELEKYSSAQCKGAFRLGKTRACLL